MTSTAKIVGGILALIGGALILLTIVIGQAWVACQILPWQFCVGFIINLMMAILALVGGIMALTGSKTGAILALVTGILITMFHLIASIGISPQLTAVLMQYSILNLMGTYIPYITIEGILALVGGIVALAGGE